MPMGTETIGKLKNQQAFKRGDVLVYALLLGLIVSLFYVFVFAAHSEPLRAIDVLYEGKSTGESLIFRYEYDKQAYEIHESWKDRISVAEDKEGLTVTIRTVYSGYNVLRILRSGEAYVQDANCSFRKDCTGFEHITKGGMVIICVPHHLKIVGVGNADTETDENPIVG